MSAVRIDRAFRLPLAAAALLALAGCGVGDVGEQVIANAANAVAIVESDEKLAPASSGVVVRESSFDVPETMARLRADAEAKGLTIFAAVDHQANAAGAGLQMRPSMLLIFGNPMLGTPLMNAAPTMAMDLPQKMLVYEGKDGRVRIAYNSPDWLAKRHGITDQAEIVGKVDTALAGLAEAAGSANP